MQIIDNQESISWSHFRVQHGSIKQPSIDQMTAESGDWVSSSTGWPRC